MAKKTKVNHNRYRMALVEKYRAQRALLRQRSLDMNLTLEDRMVARRELSELPRNSSEVRIRNRCELTGRPRGVYRKFKLCRMKLRELAHRGELPGVIKSSW